LATFRSLALGIAPTEQQLAAEEAAKANWNNTLVGVWDFVAGSFEIEDRGRSLFFYDVELTKDAGSSWYHCTFLKTHVSYRMQLNQPAGSILVWQEMAKGSDLWETTQYATRRGRMADGMPVITIMQASIWSSVSSGVEIGVVPPGSILHMRGPRQQGDGLWMAPIKPRGAIECRCIRAHEPLNDTIMKVDTNIPEGRYRNLDATSSRGFGETASSGGFHSSRGFHSTGEAPGKASNQEMKSASLIFQKRSL